MPDVGEFLLSLPPLLVAFTDIGPLNDGLCKLSVTRETAREAFDGLCCIPMPFGEIKLDIIGGDYLLDLFYVFKALLWTLWLELASKTSTSIKFCVIGLSMLISNNN